MSDGVVHSFGGNFSSQLGLELTEYVSLPTPIPNLPKIKQIACGSSFTTCVDEEGFLWSFGGNEYGQLGIGNIIDYKVPGKVQNIPPVLSVFCGGYHTFIITNDSNLWSCGLNDYRFWKRRICKNISKNKLLQHSQCFTRRKLFNVSK